jgi:hypothetical protein
MEDYLILLPGDETSWEQASPEQRAAVYEQHGRFARALAERGHTVVGGAELTHSRETRVVRGTLDDVSVTQGPYAETVEQLTGFYHVRTADLEDLLQVCGLLADGSGVEVRPVAATGSAAAEDAS